jgi:beta-glucosidase
MKNSILLLFVLSLFSNAVFSQSSKNKLTRKYLSYFQNECRRKIGQMTQITVTNFEEKGKPGVFDMV